EAEGAEVTRLGRRTTPALDLLDEASIDAAAASIAPGLQLVVDATGFCTMRASARRRACARSTHSTWRIALR
ncbi:MAG: hypothetical protein JWO26_1838, partial [Rhodospirillales bacterium]|nr:hypothetical protein [Rhodospirillales bacterium]